MPSCLFPQLQRPHLARDLGLRAAGRAQLTASLKTRHPRGPGSLATLLGTPANGCHPPAVLPGGQGGSECGVHFREAHCPPTSSLPTAALCWWPGPETEGRGSRVNWGVSAPASFKIQLPWQRMGEGLGNAGMPPSSFHWGQVPCSVPSTAHVTPGPRAGASAQKGASPPEPGTGSL